MTAQAIVKLTPRQLEVVRLIALGKCKKEVADILGITRNTVDNHLNNPRNSGVLQRLGFCDPARLAHWTIRAGLVKVGDALK